MSHETKTARVTVVERDASQIDICVDGRAIGGISLVDGSAAWRLNQHGLDLGLELADANVPTLAAKQFGLTLAATADRQLDRIASGRRLSDADRDLLHPELQAWVEEGSLPRLRHPLVYVVPYYGGVMERVFANARLGQVEQGLREAEGSRNWERYVFLHERPYRLDAFARIETQLADRDYWSLLSQLWTDSENIKQNLVQWRKFWSSRRLHRDAAMNDADRAALAAMPETLTIYRGTRYRRSVSGMSWTLREQTADWFGRRYSGGRYHLATATVAKRDVLAYLSGRNEFEIVVLPRNLRDVSVSLQSAHP